MASARSIRTLRISAKAVSLKNLSTLFKSDPHINSGFLYCMLACIFPCIPIMLLRQEARERYNIEGSTGDDAVCSFCCGPCVSCQTAVEIKERGDKN